MSHNEHTELEKSSRPGWVILPEEHLPKPTYWPATFGLGITFFFWSFVTSWVIFVVGVILMIISMAGWIQEIIDERKQH